MGLDITAYKKSKFIETVADGDEFDEKYGNRWREGFDWVYDFPDFTDRLLPLQPNGVYQSDGSFGFRVGSYSGYNNWRNELSIMALGVPAETVWKNPSRYSPFVELINFSDCEGHLGTDVCKKLLQDFLGYQEKANSHSDNPWFVESYNEWRKAFEFAADGGYISFH